MEETLAALTGFLAVALGTVMIGGAIAGAWLWGRHSATRRDIGPSDSAMDAARQTDARLVDVARAIDALVHEVERISEAQRFTARLLNDRIALENPQPATDPMRVPEKIVTPH